ncbi:DUF1810 domain-containing protein [Rhodobacteraceae bacterium RKSG542]|uniref:DUF1810 domain-containing protein n=1 Tax=Pseudovibrio flavus TaxID=2529854 RepID=UPI0012BCE1DE|nr:DUF1810 domain-containing protein [Pseudovibrio flavus]MTI18779.1 DUF1810 domain-containing protein [Pseudovibrio flavus]
MTHPSKDDLDRFLLAQDPVFSQVVEELKAGDKQSHWMWFVFPQLRKLGRSGTAHYFGIEDRDEARAYLDHPVLGPRLKEAFQLMLQHEEKSAEDILGPVDALKLRSSATLFQIVAKDNSLFQQVLDRYYEGNPCPLTFESLQAPWLH